MSLVGSLEDLGLGDILQIIHLSRKSGTLWIRSAAGDRGAGVRGAVGDRGLAVVTATQYRNPGELGDGGVLVVGASASGVQIADELNRAGREVLLAVGRHTRVPRSYRGKDIFWWLERTGRLSRTIHHVRDPAAARHERARSSPCPAPGPPPARL